jgi:hypothetical protein
MEVEIDLKEERDLLSLILLKQKLNNNFKEISKIKNNEEYERKSSHYYNTLSDLKNNKAYYKYVLYALEALKQGYKMGVNDISMGFLKPEDRMPLVLNEKQYLIKSISKITPHPIRKEIEINIIMEIFINYYLKSIKELGKRYLSIDIDPMAELEKLEKSGQIEIMIKKANEELSICQK